MVDAVPFVPNCLHLDEGCERKLHRGDERCVVIDVVVIIIVCVDDDDDDDGVGDEDDVGDGDDAITTFILSCNDIIL